MAETTFSSFSGGRSVAVAGDLLRRVLCWAPDFLKQR